MTNNKLSILVPVYNVQDYIRDCLSSIVSQTYKDWECILVDDGSTDLSGSICDEYAANDSRFSVIHKENGGLGSARITGINVARGEFIAFVDSDDWIEREMFTELMDPFMKDSCLDITICGYCVDYGTRTTPGILINKEAVRLNAVETATQMFKQIGFNWSLWGKVFRRSLFFKDDLLEHWPYGYAEDSFISYHIVKNINFSMSLPELFYHYRMREDSMMHQKIDAKRIVYFNVYRQLVEDADKWNSTVADSIFSVLLTVCIDLRYNFLETDSCHKEASLLQQYFIENEDRAQKLMDTSLRFKWEYAATISPDEYHIRQNEWIHMISDFAKTHETFYIYGTGTVAKFFVDVLRKNNIDFSGFFESKPSKQMWQGKAVVSPDILDSSNKKIGVLIAMNEKKTKEVLPLLSEKKSVDILEGWKMSYYGR